MEQSRQRTAKLIALVGKPGTGKSTIAEKLMQQNGHGIMILPEFDDWSDKYEALKIAEPYSYNFYGIKTHIYRTPEDFEYIKNYFYNGVLVLDDARNYIHSNFEYSPISEIIRRKRQKMLDIIIMAHGFSEIPPKLFSFITDYIIFPIEDRPSNRKKFFTLERLQTLERVVDKVNEAGKKDIHSFTWLEL